MIMIILSKHAVYYILPFAERNLPDIMDLLKKMETDTSGSSS